MQNISGELIPIIAIGGGIAVAIIAIVCGTICNLYRIHRQSNLKQIMLEAGVSPHDIERVINCGAQERHQPEWKTSAAPGKPASY